MPAARFGVRSSTATIACTTTSGSCALNYFAAVSMTLGLAAGDGQAGRGPRHQHFLDRRAEQCRALRRLQRLEGRTRGVLALRRGRISRARHPLHHHQHAVGAHADGRADPDLRALPADGRRTRRPIWSWRRSFASPSASPPGSACWQRLVEVLAPPINRAVMSESFRMFPESEAAGGPPLAAGEASPAMLAFASLLRGVHW